MGAEPTVSDGLESVTVKSNTQQPPSQAGKRKADADAEGGSDEKRQKRLPARFTKHPRFWFPDGNFQIQIGTVRFNLHRSRLIAASTWFEDTFGDDDEDDSDEDDSDDDEGGDSKLEVAEAVELDETVESKVVGNKKDGPEVIELDDMGVKIGDFEQLLIAMDDIVGYHQSPPPFATLASIFRAACILDFFMFKSYARSAIAALFPDSLKDVRAKTLPHAAEVIVLARQFGHLSRAVRKRAFYELARSPPTPATASALDLLAPADLIFIMQAQKRMAAEWLSIYTPPPCETCAKSSTTKQCDILWFMSLSAKYQFDPILGLATLPQDYEKQKHFCGICARIREKLWKTHASRIWKTDLDVWFGLV